MPVDTESGSGLPPLQELKHSISFTINGVKHTVGSDVPPWTPLVDFLRLTANLSGTKTLCREAGCGVCTVVVTRPDLEEGNLSKSYSVQSCLTPVYSCDGWAIETIEGLGDRFDGYHPLQTALHGFAGTQCGYCSPGMIMQMYGQMKNGPLTLSRVEKSLDGNLCRCTGYRPILEAFKSLAVDADEGLKGKLADIEEVYKGSCRKTGQSCSGCNRDDSCGNRKNKHSFKDTEPIADFSLTVAGVRWYRPTTVEGIFSILKTLRNDEKVRLVVGNTGSGVFKNDGPYGTYINTQSVPELYQISLGTPLRLGANVSLARAMEVFRSMASGDQSYAHLNELAKHWQYVANTSVRNVASWTGNLMLKHAHPSFQSDVFLTLLAVDAELTVSDADGMKTCLTLEQFLKTDMSRKVILSVLLPSLPKNTKLRTFKITPRAVNAHAYVNACFRMQLEPSLDYKIISKPLILLGGINSEFIHASQTENYLENLSLKEEKTLQEAIKLLGEEVNPENVIGAASPEYRRSLAQCLLFKAFIGFLGDQVSSKVISAGPNIERPISSSQQSFDMDKDTWPVGEPIPKLESATQISGEATYCDDIPALPNELHAALVQTTVANAKIKSINTEEAMKLPGVVSWVSEEDIPGKNNFVELGKLWCPMYCGPDPVFTSDRVIYAGQPVGIIVAENRDIANRAAKLVKVEYEDIKKPVLTIKESKDAGRWSTVVKDIKFGEFDEGIQQSPHKVTGELSFGSQYHMPMEPHSARVIPTEDGYDISCTTQWPAEAQTTAALVLNVPVNSINISVRRLGGGFGNKISRPHVLSTAAAIAARKLKRPIRIAVDLNCNMTYAGWRPAYEVTYEVGFDAAGKLEALKIDAVADVGHVGNESIVPHIAPFLQSAYYIPNFLFSGYIARTDTASSTFCRAPACAQGIAIIENIMEQIAHVVKKNPLEVRELNMVPPQIPRFQIPAHDKNVAQEVILPLLKEKASFAQRKKDVDEFNVANRWKKRGISVIPMAYSYDLIKYFNFGIQVTIYGMDGTVAISHGGIEMGQGINTKVAQVAAYILQIPVEKISIKATETMIGANSSSTAASVTSDLCCHATKTACTVLRQRLDEVEAKIKTENEKEMTWVELVQTAFATGVDLCERCWTGSTKLPELYMIWGATCLEIELDILTGVYMIRRADIIEDCGRSLSPYVDIGQVEGAFVMGLGYYTSEVLKVNSETGQKLSNSTWDYKPPTALDIPVDMRITLLPNARVTTGVLGSKATGEPPLLMSYSVVTALRQAITSFRADNGITDWFAMDTPITVEKAHQLCGVKPEQFQLEVLSS